MPAPNAIYDGSDVQLRVGEKTLSVNVQSTAGWDQFELLDFGEIQLNKVGTVDCTLGFGKTKRKGLFNLKALVFEPVE